MTEVLKHVDFLDINPRAASFQSENAALNRFSSNTYRPLVGDIGTFTANTSMI